MSLLRHHVALLEQNELTEASLTGQTFRVRPNDSDGQLDSRQRWWVLVDLSQEGDGTAQAVVSTSFDGVLWYPVVRRSTRRGPSDELVELRAFAPLIRAETHVQAPALHRAVLLLASDGPFVASLA